MFVYLIYFLYMCFGLYCTTFRVLAYSFTAQRIIPKEINETA